MNNIQSRDGYDYTGGWIRSFLTGLRLLPGGVIRLVKKISPRFWLIEWQRAGFPYNWVGVTVTRDKIFILEEVYREKGIVCSLYQLFWILNVNENASCVSKRRT